MEDRTCLIVAGGGLANLPDPMPDDIDLAIGVDSGIHLAEDLGISIDLLVGDLDSARPEAVDRARARGTAIEQHPVDKDTTDLELALEAALARRVERVIIVGGTSLDRIDHLLANAFVMAAPRFADLSIEWWVGASRMMIGRHELTIDGAAGDLVSIIPVGGDAEVTTAGLRWRLDRARLPQGTTRGVSNELVSGSATLAITAGTVFVVHTRAPHP